MPKDAFGVTQIYPSYSAASERWTFDINNPNQDTRLNFDDGSVTGIITGLLDSTGSPGSFAVDDNSAVRLNVYTSAMYDIGSIVKNHALLDKNTIDPDTLEPGRGYMMNVNDWHNVEITAFFNLISAVAGPDDSQNQIVMYCRGGHHNGTANCEGSAYKASLYFNGKTQFAKEQYHKQYAYTTITPAQITPIFGRWIGMKFCVYDIDDGNGNTAVKLELWVNDSGDARGIWNKVDEFIDKPGSGWGESGQHCNGNPDQVITWGGPVAALRWDNVTDARFKWFTIREITPTANQASAAATMVSTCTGDASPIPPTYICIDLTCSFRIANFATASCTAETQAAPPGTPPPPPPPGPSGGTVQRFIKIWYNL